MESLCSPSWDSTCLHCGHPTGEGDPTGEGEAAGASPTAGNSSGLTWVLIGMRDLLRTHSGCEPALLAPGISAWILCLQRFPELRELI